MCRCWKFVAYITVSLLLSFDLAMGDTTQEVVDPGLELTEAIDFLTILEAVSSSATADASQGDIDFIIFGSDVLDEAAIATARSTGVNALGGDDSVTFAETIDATSNASAKAGDLSIGVIGDVSVSSIWNGGASATSESTGVRGEEGGDTLDNQSQVTVVANSTSNAGSISIPVALALTVFSTDATSTGTGVASDNGDDFVFNVGTINASTDAKANSVGVDIVAFGAAVTEDQSAAPFDYSVDGGTSATATTRGISTGVGMDTVEISGELITSASSSTSSTAIAATYKGVAIAEVASTSLAESIGIDTGAGKDTITVGGALSSDATSNAYGNDVAVVGSGVAATTASRWSNGTTATAIAKGVQSGDDDDTVAIEQSGSLTTSSNATTEVASLSVTLTAEPGGRLKGNSYTDVKGLAEAQATGIDAGNGANTIENQGIVDVDASSRVFATEWTLDLKGATIPGLGKVIGFLVGKGGATSSAEATGIQSGGGLDTITNTGNLSANADADLPSLGVGLRLANSPSVNLASEVNSTATGVNSGAGNDVITNGIIPLPDQEPTEDTSEISAIATSNAFSLGIGVTGSGLLSGVSSNLDLSATATGIHAGSGDDTVFNMSTLTSNASANSTALNFLAIFNQPGEGEEAPSAGHAKVSATSSSTATAIGVDTEGDSTVVFVDLPMGDQLSSAGINFIHSETAEDDVDIVVNEGNIDVDAQTRTVTVDAVGQRKGSSVAKTTATAQSEALGIRTGGGNDTITSNGDIDVDALANTDTVTASLILGTGRAAAGSGGTMASATANGIVADGENRSSTIESVMEADDTGSRLTITQDRVAASGDDTITTNGSIDAFARSIAVGVDAALTSKGQSATKADSSSHSRSAGIVAGDGNDVVTNEANLTARSVANTDVVTISITADVGLAVSTSTGNSAVAESTGIDGDSDFSSLSNYVELYASSNLDLLEGTIPDVLELLSLSSLEVRKEELNFGGDDIVTNRGELNISTSAVNVTAAGGLVVTKGAASVFANSEAIATTTGIRGGGGNDSLNNFELINTDAVANADSVGISVSVAGVATAANKLFEGGTLASSSSVGIEGDGVSVKGQSVTLASRVDVAQEDFSASVVTSSWTHSVDGVDTINNHGAIHSTSVAVAPAVSVAVSLKGVSGAISTATAEAESAGIRAGGGADTVKNFEEIIAGAVAQADSVNVTVAPAGVGIAGNSIQNGGVVATSRAIGIDADGGFSSKVHDREISIHHAGEDIETSTPPQHDVRISDTVTEVMASGDDVLENSALVRARATSVVLSVAGSYSGAGVAAAFSTAESNAYASALDSGGGNDQITNSAGVSAVATGNADSLNVAFATYGVALAADAVWNGGTSSTVQAIGINADGEFESKTTTTQLEGSEAGVKASHIVTQTMAAGDDTIINDGYVTAVATAVSPSIGVSLTMGGVAVVATTATSNANAVSIDAGAGADTITNTAELTSVSTSNADVVSVGLAVGVVAAGDALWDGGVTANSNASGIKAHGILSRTTGLTLSTIAGDSPFSRVNEIVDDTSADTVTNSGIINATSTAATVDLNGVVAPYGVAVAISTAKARSTAFGIETGAGSDTVTNSSAINALSNTEAVAINVSGTAGGLALAGDAIWDGGTTATSSANAIMTRDGVDTITNTGYLNVNSIAVAASVAEVVSVYGVAGGSATSTAISDATGINSGAGNDTVTSGTTIDVESVANADSLGIALNVFGVAAVAPDFWDGGTFSLATAEGIEAGSGLDTVTNNALIDAHATSVTAAGSVAFTYGGVAGAITTSTAVADVEGIDGGEGDDALTSRHEIRAYADATAVAATGSIGVFGVALSGDATWDGGTGAQALSDGISGDAGNDTINNTAQVDVDARARANSIQATFSVIGVAVSNSTSETYARSSALDGGAGDDTITNSGDLTSDAIAHSTSVGADIVGIGAAGSIDSEWDGGTGSNAVALGISGGGGNDVLDNRASITVNAESDADSVQVAATAALITVATASSTAESTGTGIAGGEGQDTITNNSDIVVVSDSDAQAAAVGITLWGATGTDPFMNNITLAEAWANGITGGAENDTIMTLEFSTLDVTANALARDNDVTGSYTVGFSVADANSMAKSHAVGVDAGAGNDLMILHGVIGAHASSEANGRAIAFETVGANIMKAGTLAEAYATGVSGGAGNDTVISDALITIDGTATNLGRTVGVVEAGAAIGVAESGATTTLHGISLGEGENGLENDGDITARATTDVVARSFGTALAGFSGTNAQATSTANVFGVHGGDGVDNIRNSANIDVTGTSSVNAKGISINIVGAGVSDSIATAESHSMGIATNAGMDTVLNTGSVASNANSNGTLEGGFAFSAVGAGIARGFTTVTSEALGIGTGAEKDVVINAVDAVISASATSNSTASGGGTVTVVGASKNNLTANVEADGVGVDLGEGEDVLINDGRIDVEARSHSTVSASEVTVAGAGSAVVGSNATATASGIKGGAGKDEIINNGNIEVGITDAETLQGHWMALLDLETSSFTFAGAASSNSTAEASTESTGIHGGADDDQIINTGDLSVFANAKNKSTASSVNIFGTAGSTDNAGASSAATGMAGGDGVDTVTNIGNVLVSARTRLELDGTSYRLGGAGNTSGTLTANTTVWGLVGNGGDDTLRNEGLLRVRGGSEMESTGNSNTTFGGATTAANSGATTTATGLSGDAGDDTILNIGLGAEIDVEANVTVESGSSSYTFVGAPSSGAVLTGVSTAMGIQGGDGIDFIDSDGSVTVTANASLDLEGGARSTIGGGAESTGTATTQTTATGFSGGEGDDIIRSAGNLSVVSDSRAASHNTTNNAAAILSNSRAEAQSNATSTSTGFTGGAGLNLLINDGDAYVAARSSANSVSYANGAAVSITGTATAISLSTAHATAIGMKGEDGNNVVMNSGVLTVSADAWTTQPIQTTIEVLSIETDANPDTVEPTEAPDHEGSALPSLADEAATPDGYVVFWNGEKDADGVGPIDDPLMGPPGAHYVVVTTEVVESDGSVTITRSWQPVLVTAYEREYFEEGHATDAVGRGKGANGNGVGRATGTTTAIAKGIELGDGDNSVLNAGSLSVTADANAAVIASATGSKTGDATASATATATATAIGMGLGNGNNVIENTGELWVTAIAKTSTSARTAPGGGICVPLLFWSFCVAPGTSNPSSSDTRNVTATGIATGDGNNTITNDGSIHVIARADDPDSVAVVGIQTKAGNDTIINNGLVSALVENLAGTVTGFGMGIDTGAGNDSIELWDGSIVVGSVGLGEGDDTLTLMGNASIKDHLGGDLNPQGGAGVDHLVLSGPGAFLGVPESFERATKRDLGTYVLNTLPTVAELNVEGGTLELGTSYTFATGGVFNTFVRGDGSYGKLLVNGTATLDGSMAVAQEGDEFISDGSRYSVISSTDTVQGDFVSVTLPDPLPLLSFEVERFEDSLDVVATATQIAAFATSDLQISMAQIFDSLAPSSSDELREEFGKIQSMEAGFDQALDSLSPDAHLAATTGAVAVIQQTTQMLRTHLGDARAVHRGSRSVTAAYSPVSLSFDGMQMNVADVPSMPMYYTPPVNSGPAARSRRPQTWLMGFGGWSDVDEVDGYTDYDQDMVGFAVGADYLLADDLIAGFSIAYADSELDMGKANAKTDVETWSGTLYATALWDRTYVEGGVYFGWQDFDSKRTLTIGESSSQAHSQHDGDSAMVFLGTGHSFEFESWEVEPYATLYYVDLSEDAFEEKGAGSLNQVVEKQSADALLGELGGTFSTLQPMGTGTIDWHGTLAYGHDFDIDDVSINYAFLGEPTSSFNVDDRDISEGSAILGAGLAYQNGQNTLSLDYRGQFNSDYEHHFVGARFIYTFH